MAVSAAVLAARKNRVWAALAKVAEKQFERDQLEDGSASELAVRIAGEVDGKPVALGFDGTLSVGYPQQAASSTAPPAAEILALALSKLDSKSRDKFLAAGVEDAKGALAEVVEFGSELVARCEKWIEKLRDTKTITRRGNVRCDYRLVD